MSMSVSRGSSSFISVTVALPGVCDVLGSESSKNGIDNLTLTSKTFLQASRTQGSLECRSGSMVSIDKAFGSQGSFHLLVQSVQSM